MRAGITSATGCASGAQSPVHEEDTADESQADGHSQLSVACGGSRTVSALSFELVFDDGCTSCDRTLVDLLSFYVCTSSLDVITFVF